MRKLIVSILSVFVLTISFGLATEAGATLVYDLAADWSASSNPNGAWTYGYYTGNLTPASFTAFANNGNIQPPFSQLEYWSKTNPESDPNIIYNPTVNDVNTGALFSNITFHAGEVTFGPALGPTVARWTAPAPGDYLIGATFSTVQEGNTAPNAYVYDGSMNDLGTVPAYSASVGYNMTLTLTGSQYIDFIVWGGDRNNKTTEVSAWIEPVSEIPTPIPEPTTMFLLGTGLVGVAGAARRKKKNQA